MQRRRPRQLHLPIPATWGGKRAGAGRKPSGSRPAPPHRPRAAHDVRQPLHATLRAVSGVPSLRRETHLAGCPGCHPSVKPRLLPDRSFLGAVRSSSPDRRGRLACRAQARTVGTGGPDREGDQPARWPEGSGLVRSLPRAPAREPPGGAARDDVCAAEFLQASSSAAGRRSTELGTVVRWVEGAAARRRRTHARSLCREPGSGLWDGDAPVAGSPSPKRRNAT